MQLHHVVLQVKSRVEGYFDVFPPKSYNVAVKTREGLGSQSTHKTVVVTKDVRAGEVVYKEHPVVAVLDADVQSAGTHCTHCFRIIQSPFAIPLPADNPLPSTFCSKACLVANKTQSHSLLFSLDSVLPAEIPSPPPTSEELAKRKNAQNEFADHIKKEGRAGPLLVARFIARQVGLETSKMVGGAKTVNPADVGDFTDAESGGYLLADHIERFRYVEVEEDKAVLPLLTQVLGTALPGLEQFVTEERYSVLLGKMAYNAFGICPGGGRNDRPVSDARPEDVEKTRTPYGTSKQIGSALYTVSSYLNHSCVPSARPSFSSGTTELHLIANRDLKKGDELTIAFVDVTQHAEESVKECRRRRRVEVVRGWKFACGCERCEEEGKELSTEEKGGEETQKDESKVEESLSRFADSTSDSGLSAPGGVE